MKATGDTTTHNNGKGQHGDTTATGGSTATARGSRATGGTIKATGDKTRQHDKGNARQTTTIRYFFLMRLAED